MARVGKKTAAKRGRPANRVRIIGGRWRGARITFPSVEALRPSPDRVRETLFNWLKPHIVDARCLDLFAGSGVLGVEALSRGARAATFVEREPQLAKNLKETLARLRAQDWEVFVADAREFLRRTPAPYDIVFLDPPFAAGLLDEVCAALGRGWLAPQSWVYIECPAEAPLPGLPPEWSVHRTSRAGNVGYHLLRVETPIHERGNP